MAQPQNHSSVFAKGIERANSQRATSQQGSQSLSSLQAKLKYKASVVAAICFAIALSMGLIYLIEVAVNGEWEGTAEFLGFIFFGIGLYEYFTIQESFSYREYSSLHGSRTNTGKLRCIYCGHVGIYTHGQYKSDTTFHDCARCGRTLYTS